MSMHTQTHKRGTVAVTKASVGSAGADVPLLVYCCRTAAVAAVVFTAAVRFLLGFR